MAKKVRLNNGNKQKNRTPIVLLCLHMLLFIYSVSGVLSKNAATQPFLSVEFILLYGGMLAILFFYAIGWQQIIKRIPLTLAFANKAVGVIWGIFWGVLLFDETVSLTSLVGGLLVICGVILFAVADRDDRLKTARNGVSLEGDLQCRDM